MQSRSAFRIHPFARLLLFYFCGIYAGSLVRINSELWIWIQISLVTILACILLFITFRPSFHTNKISGIVTALLFLSSGLLNWGIYELHVRKIRETSGFNGVALLQIDDHPVETSRSVKCFAGIDNIYGASPVFRARQKILVYLEKDSCSKRLAAGDRIAAKVFLREIPAPGNPEAFNYREYLAAKRIINQTYIRSGSWYLTDDKHFSMKEISCRLQHALIMKYRSTGMNPRLFSILSAVTLGYKNEIDSQTKQAFSKAGVMHVMALSGFNVAVIAFALNYLLLFASLIKYGNFIRLALIISCIWFFAFVTGFSPSVTRASLMISLVLVGKELRRNLKSTNILYSTAFILTVLTPALIYDVGFQLSFAAVYGIIVFQPVLGNLFHINNRFISMIWQLFTVSLAAQLATMPFTMAYFHQFPVYFWITNLYVVPLVSVIICVAMLFLLLSFIQPVMLIIGKLLGWLTALLYKSVSIIEIMPFAVISNIRISMFQLILLLVLLLTAGAYIHFRKKLMLIVSLSIYIVFQITGIFMQYHTGNQQLMLIGQLKNTTFINLIEGKNSMIISDSSSNNPGFRYSTGNFWIKQGITVNRAYKLSLAHNTSFSFAGRDILLAASGASKMQGKADIVVITGKANPVSGYFSDHKPLQVILDSSVPYYKEDNWLKICSAEKIPCHIVRKQGAYLIHFR